MMRSRSVGDPDKRTRITPTGTLLRRGHLAADRVGRLQTALRAVDLLLRHPRAV